MHAKLKDFISIIVLTLIAVLGSVLLLGCSKKNPETVVKPEEVRIFFSAAQNKELERIENRIKFFSEKVKKDNFGCLTTSMLGSAYSSRFALTGNIADLITSDSLLWISNRKYNGTKASVFLSLSMNALSRHEFKSSVNHALNAYGLGENKSISAGVLFDALAETGDYEQAERMLLSIKNIKEVSYMVRASKFAELKGDMDSAIVFMQLALAEANTNPSRIGLICWAHNSLAALYIKNEDFSLAYEHYISALKLDNNYYKALEGIAVIASVNDGNHMFAEEILLYVSSKISSPDPYLSLYKNAGRQKNDIKKKEYRDKFMKLASDPAYGKMYNRYLAEIYAEEFGDYTKAKQIAEAEINERPTPASYFLLAWVCYKAGETVTAIGIIKDNVEDKTFDPDILAKIDRIYLDETKKM